MIFRIESLGEETYAATPADITIGEIEEFELRFRFRALELTVRFVDDDYGVSWQATGKDAIELAQHILVNSDFRDADKFGHILVYNGSAK